MPGNDGPSCVRIHKLNANLIDRMHPGQLPFNAAGHVLPSALSNYVQLNHRFQKLIQSECQKLIVSYLSWVQQSAEIRALQPALSFYISIFQGMFSAVCGLHFTDLRHVAFSCKQRFQFN